jgi:NAD dependent epimerase/dehydratase family enzyme
VVLTPSDATRGAAPPFRVGLGGPVGSGEQFVSWIGIDDLVRAIHHALVHDGLAPPVNAVAPEPVRNRSSRRSAARCTPGDRAGAGCAFG